MIKKFFIKKSLNIISEFYPDYDNSKLDEIRYGLEAIYLSLTKMIVILFIAWLLGIFKESIIVILFFSILRTVGFGLHATESWQCWIATSILFIGTPYLCIYIDISIITQYIMIIFSILCYIFYAPADTRKRPLVKKNKRIRFKLIILIISFIYLLIFFSINNIFIKNVIVYTMIMQAVLIHPLTYKVFKLPYKNYERYVFSK